MELVLATSSEFNAKAADLTKIAGIDQDRLVISAMKIEGEWVIVSRFGDDIWNIGGHSKNVNKYQSTVNFKVVPEQYRNALKEITYCYLMRGRERTRRAKGLTISGFVTTTLHFIKYIERFGIVDLRTITPITFNNFAHECQTITSARGKPLSRSTICKRLIAIEAMYELSQHTKTPLSEEPWPETSALALSKLTGANAQHRNKGLTPLIPDEVFCSLFQKSHEYIMRADYLLDIRDDLDDVNLRLKNSRQGDRTAERERVLAKHGYEHGASILRQEITSLRTACYIVIASTSGCRNHELANIQTGAHHKTEDDNGEVYHWLRAASEKTYIGVCDWMIPAIAVRALRIMERWATPYQNMITREITRRRKLNPRDPEIVEAQKHANSLFLGFTNAKGYEECRTLAIGSWNKQLQEFLMKTGYDWTISSHQLRKKFANYAAHSQFGDLRYLKEHFKHWTMDMTLMYAMDETWGEHFDLDLYSEIESELSDIKESVVSSWIEDDHLGGGYGQSLKQWQRDPLNIAIFKDHASMIRSVAESTPIRSTGHSWCTANDTRCLGNTLERSRCGGCTNAVTGGEHVPIYQSLYKNLSELLDCKDLGDSGMLRVKRDMGLYASALSDLGVNVEINLGQAT